MCLTSRSTQFSCGALAVILLWGFALAQVQTDGSVGPAVTLSGQMVIGSELGKQSGINLFHSFTLFNIRTGESATFTSSLPGIENIIGRVTGGTVSTIDGYLSCDVEGASLWLINPKGIAFGENASVDVPGSFYASTADYVVFADGSRLSTNLDSPSSALLSIANPSAFGFLGETPAPISVSGGELEVTQGGIIALVGGKIDISGASLDAPGGQLNLISVASAGETVLTPEGTLDLSSFSALGDVSIKGGSDLRVSDYLDEGSGAVFIRGGSFLMDASKIRSMTFGGDGRGIDIGVTGDLTIQGGSRISTTAEDTGRAGDIRLSAGGDVKVAGTTWISTSTEFGSGDGGDISINARNIDLSVGARVFTDTDSGTGNAGSISMTASDTISISGKPDYANGIGSDTLYGSGNAGNITLSTKELTMNGGTISSESILSDGSPGSIAISVGQLDLDGAALISTSNRGFGVGGDLRIQATEAVRLNGNSRVQASTSYSGTGGLVSITAPDLAVNKSVVSTDSFGSGKAGDIEINVSHLSLISGQMTSEASLTSSGAAGNITISASQSLTMTNAGSSRLDRSLISTATWGDGDAGTVTITSPEIVLDDSVIDGTPNDPNLSVTGKKGKGGSIKIDVGELELRNGASIQVGTYSAGKGGSVEINASKSISITGFSPTLSDFRSGIDASAFGKGDAGDITLTTPSLVLDGGSVSASTAGSGSGGKISVNVGTLMLSNDANVQVASYSAGRGGILEVNADEVWIAGNPESQFKTGLSSGAQGSGAGGDIRLTANSLHIDGGGMISAKATGAGNAGTLNLVLKSSSSLLDSMIVTTSEQAAGGNINLNLGGNLYLRGSQIRASANGVTSQDNGGNLTISGPQFLIMNRSDFLAKANAGNGGNISLTAYYFLKSADSRIDASSRQGLDGNILIDSPNQVTGTVPVLTVPLLDISEILRERCAARLLREHSSFTIEGRGGVPPRPGTLIWSWYPR